MQASFSMLITLLFDVILNFQSTKMIFVFIVLSIFSFIKCYTNLSRNLTNYINQHKYFLLWFFNCFYLCQVIKTAWIINRKIFTFDTKFIFLIGLSSVKCLQLTKFKVKCYRCFINLKFSESIRKKCDEHPSARISLPKQLNVFNILILFMIAPLLLSFFNHILVFFVGLFQFSLKVSIIVYKVTANHFRMRGRQFYRSFIIKVDYLIYYTGFFNRDTFLILVFSLLSTDISCYYIGE